MSAAKQWTPNDWIRLTALIGGFILFGIGAWMLFQGISAEGIVDLKSSILSGTLKTSSAGLYICFFALFVIIFVLVSLLGPSKRTVTEKTRKASRLFPVFWCLLLALGACVVGSVLVESNSRTAFMWAIGALTFPLVTTVAAIIKMVAEEDA